MCFFYKWVLISELKNDLNKISNTSILEIGPKLWNFDGQRTVLDTKYSITVIILGTGSANGRRLLSTHTENNPCMTYAHGSTLFPCDCIISFWTLESEMKWLPFDRRDFLIDSFCIFIQMSLKFVPKIPNKPVFVQIMIACQTTNSPFSEPT